MNKQISLPRIRKSSSTSKPISNRSRKNSLELNQPEGIILDRNVKGLKNQESSKEISGQRSQSLKLLRNKRKNPSEEEIQVELVKQKKFGLQQNGKLSKITQISAISKVLSSQRSKSSATDRQDKKIAAKIKKQLNQVSSQTLIFKKQIKAMQGRIIQLKQQINNFQTQHPKQSDRVVQSKIEQVKRKTQMSKYDQQILKNMKQRLKKILIYYQKKTIQERVELQKQQKRNKILKQRSATREQSINKQKNENKTMQQRQQFVNKLVQLSVQDIHKKLKIMNEHKDLNEKHANRKLINQNEYHYEVYKKEQGKILSQLHTNRFFQNMLESQWNKYSKIYEHVQKAQKLMEMHSLDKNYQQFNPMKIYFGSIQTQKQLQNKIKSKQSQLSNVIKRNTLLKKQWQNNKYEQIDEQQKILDKTRMEIKSGKVQQKQVIQQKHRQFVAQMRKKMQLSKQRAAKISRIKDWVFKIQSVLGFQPRKRLTLEDRLISIMQYSKRQNKSLVQKKSKH